MNIDTKIIGQDKFNFATKILLESQNYLDLTQETSCYSFIIEGSEPLGTMRKFIFKIDDTFYYFKLGTLVQFNYYVDFDNVLEYGNSAAELLALQNISAFLGKKIYVICAMYNLDNPINPTVTNFGLRVSSFNNIYQKNFQSQEYNLPNKKIISIDAEKFTQGNANINTSGRIKVNNVWQDWTELNDLKYKICDAVQVKAEHTLTRLDGQDASKVNFKINYCDANELSGNKVEIIFIPEKLPDKFFDELDTEIYDDDIFPTESQIKSIVDGIYLPTYDSDPVTVADILQLLNGDSTFEDAKNSTCLVLLESRGEVESYVAYYPEKIHRFAEIGIASGEVDEISLDESKINPESLVVQADGQNIIPKSFDSLEGKIFVKAEQSQVLTAEYEVGGEENFLPMDLLFSDGTLKCFVYRTTSPTTLAAVKICSTAEVENYKVAFN